MGNLNTSNHKASHNWVLYSYLMLLAWLPLPLGSKLVWAISIAEVWCYLIAIMVLVLWVRHPHGLPKSLVNAKFACALLVLNLLWLLVQCVPLPLSWLDILSPHASALYAQMQVEYGTISLDTEATHYQFQTAVYLFTFFCLTLYLIDSRQKLRWLVYTVLASALAQALYGSFMILNGMEYSFFISKAALHSHIGSATGTFTNRDHLAGYLEMALALGVGYMLTMLSGSKASQNWKQRIRNITELLLGPKARLRLVLILLCLGLVLTHSRGGNLAFFSSLGIAGVIFLLLAREKPRATIVFLSSLIVLDIIIIGSWVGLSKVMTRLEKTSMLTEQRDDAYLATYPMIQDYVISGVGAGNYFSTFPMYKTPQLAGYWNHAHNDYLEIMAEQGVIGFSLLAGVVLWSMWIAMKVFRELSSTFALGMSFASLMGTIAILIHSAVDFNLQILANSSTFMVILAIPFICYSHQLRQRSVRE
ncbi:MAG: O-antigen ligase family protein [Mariprofundaceae bacterium]|nr:O-antigen ligase family protein [Mariprofundaceae bacterium]